MMCGWAKERIAASWAGELDPGDQTKLRHHLSECPECAAEMAQLTAMWDRLADLPSPEPSLALQVRWKATLESMGVSPLPRRTFSLGDLWPNRRVWQVAIAVACLLVGLVAGGLWQRDNRSEMVVLSMLREQSASERLRGVDYSARMPRIEPEVITALIQAVNQDPSVNVRLAAIDALTRASGQLQVRQSLEQSLNRQDSPTVQAALIGYLVDARDRQAVGALRQLSARPDLDVTVRERAGRATQQLTEFR